MSELDAVILLNWKKPEVTIECLASVFQSRPLDFKVFVADNHSDDGSVEQLQSCPYNIELIVLDANYGFTGGCNRAAQHVLRLEPATRSLLFLNNDTLVEPEALNRLFTQLNSSDKVGIVTPLILNYPMVDLVWAAGTDFSETTFVARRTLAGSHANTPSVRQARALHWATGCCLAIRADLFVKMGGFWEELFMSAEDVDLSFKVKRAGFDIMYEPSSVIYHKDAVSSGGHDSPMYVYYQMRNEMYFRRKWVERRSLRIISFGRLYLSLARRCLSFLLNGNILAIQAVLNALWDFATNKLGKREPF